MTTMKDVRVSLMTPGINVGSEDARFSGAFCLASDRYMRLASAFSLMI
ncbi:hypothetical protein BSU04_00140 [Caballeronia sordidicola]|uniref:Uncharacterized protein n=1 Tax=Caballeronia sordidicola TaxID=196367 RepID=A0A226XB90_CABSO|nr:hypothetical protein BSU04_00140 [Caballeronia sordidicola]